MTKDLGGVAICDAYSPAFILAFYFINWLLLGVIPLSLVYSVVTGSPLFDLSFGPTAALAALTLIDGGVIGLMLSYVMFISLLFLIANFPVANISYNIVILAFIALRFRMLARYYIAVARFNSLDLNDPKRIDELNRTFKEALAKKTINRRYANIPIVIIPFLLIIAILANFNNPSVAENVHAILLPLVGLLAYFAAQIYLNRLERLLVFEGRPRRYVSLFPFTYPDVILTEFVGSKVSGLMIMIAIYFFTMISFASLYYYVDHCSATDPMCRLVDKEPVKYSAEEQSDNSATKRESANFFLIASCAGGVPDCRITVNRFLPYLYFSVVTTTTVGYGDISAKSVTATWIVILHHVIAVALLIGMAGQVAGFVLKGASQPSS